MDDFGALDLHDAFVTAIAIDWAAGVITIDASVFRVGLSSPAEACKLVWSGVTRFVANRELPWGPSSFINAAKFKAPSSYEIEMQSGDLLLIDAKGFVLRSA
jgi:hypothetical protein